MLRWWRRIAGRSRRGPVPNTHAEPVSEPEPFSATICAKCGNRQTCPHAQEECRKEQERERELREARDRIRLLREEIAVLRRREES